LINSDLPTITLSGADPWVAMDGGKEVVCVAEGACVGTDSCGGFVGAGSVAAGDVVCCAAGSTAGGFGEAVVS